MMAECGIEPNAAAIARHYAGLIDGFVLDDGRPGAGGGHRRRRCIAVEVTATVMTTRADKQALAQAVLALAGRIGPQSSSTA